MQFYFKKMRVYETLTTFFSIAIKLTAINEKNSHFNFYFTKKLILIFCQIIKMILFEFEH